MPKMKDFIFSNYLRGSVLARIEKHTIVKILIFVQITLENEEKIGEKKERVFFPFTFQLIYLLIDNI